MNDFSVILENTALAGSWTGDNPGVRDALSASLPLEGRASKWGDELYMMVEVEVDAMETQLTVEPGTIAYWPAGPAVCLFWGPTPASTDGQPTAASPVARVGTVEDIAPLTDIDGATQMRIEANA